MFKYFKILGAYAAIVATFVSQPSFAVDLTKLPLLKHGDISISNDNPGSFTLYITPEGCAQREVKVGPKESVAVRCPGAKTVSVFYIIVDAAGKPHERKQLLEVDNHYGFGWDDELKAYVKLIRLFDDKGRIVR